MSYETIKNTKDDFGKYLLCKKVYESGEKSHYIYCVLGKILFNWKRYEDAIEIINTGLKYFWNSYYLRKLKGDILWDKCLYAQSIRQYRISLILCNSKCDDIAEIKSSMALNYFSLGKVNKAKRIVSKLLKQFPECLKAQRLSNELFGIEFQGSDYFDFSVNKQILPFLHYESEYLGNKNAKLYLLVIDCLKKLNVEMLEKVKDEYDEDFYLRVLGRTCFELSEYDRAIGLLRKSVMLNDSLDNMLSLAYCLGFSDANNECDESERIYDKILLKCPDHEDALQEIILISEDMNKVDEAIKKLLVLNPKNYFTQINAGDAYFKCMQFCKAIEYYDKARDLCFCDNPSQISLYIANCYKMLNNIEQAKIEAERALIENPKNEEAKAFIEGL